MNLNMNIKEKRDAGLAHNRLGDGGFTLLELLIVISIIAILSVALIFVINPAETLRKSRDAQRISDLNTMKTALGLYTTSTTAPYLGVLNSNVGCKTGSAGGTYAAGSRIWYSVVAAITDATLDNGSGSAPVASSSASIATNTLTDGTGWLPVNFDSLIGGSPISNLPLDPVNVVPTADLTNMSTTTLAYRYACNSSSLTYEIDTVLESDTYTTGSDNKLTKDGGNRDSYYEVGTNLKILGTGGSATDANF